MITNFFAGANTAMGFYSHYNYLNLDSFTRVYILKGGPGAGKSTLIKNIAEIYKTEYDVDMFNCSADVNSLDGVYIHGLNVSILDGTAPHTTDPRLPGAVQQIVDLGRCWDYRQLTPKRREILALTNSISDRYKLAYKWLGIAAKVATLIQDLEREKSVIESAKADAKRIAKLLPNHGNVYNRKAFATAITANGLVNFLPKLLDIPLSLSLRGNNRLYNAIVLGEIKEILEESNIPATYLYCGLQPDQLEHIYIPGSFGLFSSHYPHTLPSTIEEFGPGTKPKGELDYQQDYFIAEAVKALAQAKALHLELEEYYIPHVNFEKVRAEQDMIVQQLEELK